MIKILYLLSTLKESGPINVIYDLVKNIDRNNFTPVIATFTEYKNSVMAKKFEELGVELHYLDLNKKNWFFKGKRVLDKLLKKVNPDMVHTQCFIFTVLSGMFLNNYKQVETIHSNFLEDFKLGYNPFIRFFMKPLFIKSIRKIRNNICVSKMIKQILENIIPNVNFDYIDNGIDVEKFNNDCNKQELRKKLNLPLDKKIFIWAGVLVNRKNPNLLAYLIKKLKNSNSFFVICGDGYLKESITESLKDIDNVLITGNVKNIDEYLKASDYYISTSLNEGLPLSVLEGMACGLPVLLSDIEQHKYIFKDENIGFLFESQNLNSMLETFSKLVNADYGTMSKCARDVAVNNFSSKLMAKKYEEMYLCLR